MWYGALLNVMWQPGWEGGFGENVCAQWCPTFWDPLDWSPLSVRETFQARILVWVAISSSVRSSWPTYRTVSLVYPTLQAYSLPLNNQGSPLGKMDICTYICVCLCVCACLCISICICLVYAYVYVWLSPPTPFTWNYHNIVC